MQYNHDTTQDLQKCTVAIQRSGDGKVLGTGIVVADDGLILTCYHVLVGDINNKTLDGATDIYFPSIPEIKGRAIVLEEHCDASSDIAFLQLQQKLPEQVEVAELSETIDPTHTFRSFGFRKKIFDGLYSDGLIQGKVRKKFKKDNSILLQEAIQLRSDGIDYGMSGAAVLDTQINRVIGIVSEYLATSNNIDKNLALAIPVKSILEVYPELKAKNAGLRIKEFLRKIGAEGVKKYARIDELFVSPLEYEDVKRALNENRIVFITGPQECGKTYTAIRVLYEYYLKGFHPRFIRYKYGSIKQELIDIIYEIKPYSILYLEDPFGATESEYFSDKKLNREISKIIEIIQNSNNVYVIITSREEVFKRFKVDVTADINFKDFETKLNLASYNYERRKEMLLRHAKVIGCRWLEQSDLKLFIFESMESEMKLSTPLNIEDFVIATKEITDIQRIKEKINKKSRETIMSFAGEIKEMSADKKLFLLFPFISENLLIDFIRDEYEYLKNDLGMQYSSWGFDRMLNYFRDDKIDISSNHLRFSHFSYHEAIKYILSEDQSITEMEQILNRMLIRLKDSDPYSVASVIINHFSQLADDGKNLVFTLAKNEKLYGIIYRSIILNYNNLPDNVKELLIEIVEKDSADGSFRRLDYYNINTLKFYIEALEKFKPKSADPSYDQGLASLKKFYKVELEILDSVKQSAELIMKISRNI